MTCEAAMMTPTTMANPRMSLIVPIANKSSARNQS
jgi:hypothetical protein